MTQTTKTVIRFDPNEVRTDAGRRTFLRGLAIAAGATALGPMILRGTGINQMLRAQGTGETENLSDVAILNYALTLEYLEATFYLRANNSGTLPMSATIASIDPDGDGLPGTVSGLSGITLPAPATLNAAEFSTVVRDHEIIHVVSLQAGLAAAALNRADFAFDFGTAFDSAANFLATAQALEDTGVSAYLGQAANIDDGGYLGTAGQILGVEAEHAATIRLFRGQPVSDGNFDVAKTSAEILAIADDFITDAPTLPFP